MKPLGFRLILAGALLWPASAFAQVRTDIRITDVQRDGQHIRVRIDADGAVGAVPSEPFHLGGGRSRVFITLSGARLREPIDSQFPHAGMLTLRAQQRDDGVLLTADVAGLADYAVERTPAGVVFLVELERPADATVQSQATPAWDARARALADAMLAGALRAASALQSFGRSAYESVSAKVPANRLPVALIAGGLLLIGLALLLRSLRGGRSTQPAAAEADPSLARVRAARALAGEGLDAGAIARRTGLARDVAALIVQRDDTASSSGTGTIFRGRPRREAAAGFGREDVR